MQTFMDTILAGVNDLPVKENIRLMCEPGRALVAEAESLIVRVDARRGNNLYINDGSYGMLFDAAHLGFIFPVRLVSRDVDAAETLVPFELWGPTCDSIDYMKGPVPAAGLGCRGRLHRDRQHGRLCACDRRPLQRLWRVRRGDPAGRADADHVRRAGRARSLGASLAIIFRRHFPTPH